MTRISKFLFFSEEDFYRMLKTELKLVMMTVDLEEVTCRYVSIEKHVGRGWGDGVGIAVCHTILTFNNLGDNCRSGVTCRYVTTEKHVRSRWGGGGA